MSTTNHAQQTPTAHVCLGDPTHIAFSDLVKPINCGSKERAAAIVQSYNSHAALVAALSPRMWTREMSDAWHRNIPDVQAAFAALLKAAKGKA